MKNLRLAIRSLLHFKLYSTVNILGLAMSLACLLVIARYVHTETSVDSFIPNRDNIYLTTMELTHMQFGVVPAVESFDQDFTFFTDPAVKRKTKFQRRDYLVEMNGNYHEVKALNTDTIFLEMMDYPILRGEANIWRPESALITQELAYRLFGKEDPIGKTVANFSLWDNRTFTVTGVLKELPGKSSISFDMIVPLDEDTGFSFLELYPNQDYRNYNQKYAEGFYDERGTNYKYSLCPLNEIYFNPDWEDKGFNTGNKTTVTILTLVGFMILLIGVINFINIYTAVVLRRGREFGMKKVFGAGSRSIFLQLWVENMLMIGFALVIALSVTEIMNPLVRNILHFDQMPLQVFDLLFIMGLWIILPLLATLFPFLNYGYRKPITSLRSVGKTGGKPTVRRILLGLQYAITIIMIITSLFFLKQFRYMTEKDLGFRTSDVIQISMRHEEDSKESGLEGKIERMEQKVEESPLFSHWTAARSPLKSHSFPLEGIHLPGHDSAPEGVYHMSVDKDWFEIFELKTVAGKIWDEMDLPRRTFYFGKSAPDMNRNVIVTESALAAFGLDLSNYSDAVLENEKFSTTLTLLERLPDGGIRTERTYDNLRIQAVVEDIYTDHLSKSHRPLVFTKQSSKSVTTFTITASIVPGKRQEALAYLNEVYNEIFTRGLKYTFLEDEVRAMYEEDRKIATVYSIFTVIAIIISIMGLFSLSLFDIQQRRREIAIRKVNGATTGEVLGLLLRRYLYLLGVAFLIAAPIGWFAIHRYLEGFAYKSPVSWWIFAVALLLTAGVSLLTLIWQTRKAASANPARVIRNE